MKEEQQLLNRAVLAGKTCLWNTFSKLSRRNQIVRDAILLGDTPNTVEVGRAVGIALEPHSFAPEKSAIAAGDVKDERNLSRSNHAGGGVALIPILRSCPHTSVEPHDLGLLRLEMKCPRAQLHLQAQAGPRHAKGSALQGGRMALSPF